MDTLSITTEKNKNTIPIIILIVALGLLLHYIIQEWILVPEVYYRSLSSKLSTERIEMLIAAKSSMTWVSYLIETIQIVGSTLLVAAVISIGTYFFGYRLSFKQSFGVAAFAAFIPMLGMLCKVAWFLFYDTSFTLSEFNQMELFSLHQLFAGSAPAWLGGMLNWVNIFEVAYWIVLCVELSKHLQVPKSVSLGIVSGSYGLSMLLLLSAGAFFQIWFS